jgi:hypothetical protein
METAGKSWRKGRSGHQVGLRFGAGKPQFFERGANGMGGVAEGNRNDRAEAIDTA